MGKVCMKEATPNRRGAHVPPWKVAQISIPPTMVFDAFHGEELLPIIWGLKLSTQGDKGAHTLGA